MARTMVFGLLSAALLALAIYDGRVSEEPPPAALPANRPVGSVTIHRPEDETRRAGDSVMGYTSARDATAEAASTPAPASNSNPRASSAAAYTDSYVARPAPRAIPSLNRTDDYPATGASGSSSDRGEPVGQTAARADDWTAATNRTARSRIERLPPVDDIRPRHPDYVRAEIGEPHPSASGPQAPVPRVTPRVR